MISRRASENVAEIYDEVAKCLSYTCPSLSLSLSLSLRHEKQSDRAKIVRYSNDGKFFALSPEAMLNVAMLVMQKEKSFGHRAKLVIIGTPIGKRRFHMLAYLRETVPRIHKL